MALAPLDVVIVGTALETDGLIGFNTISGVGLITFGFLWPCDSIWQPSDAPIATTWVAANIPTSSVEICADDMGGLG